MILNKYCYDNVSRLSSLINAESCNIANHLVRDCIWIMIRRIPNLNPIPAYQANFLPLPRCSIRPIAERIHINTFIRKKNKSYLLSSWKPFGIEWNNKFVEPLSAGVVPLRPEYQNVSTVQGRKRGWPGKREGKGTIECWRIRGRDAVRLFLYRDHPRSFFYGPGNGNLTTNPRNHSCTR